MPRIGRGLAAGDLDNDGRLDLVIVAQNSPLAFFHNQTGPAGHFVTIRLEGTTSNRDAVGAKVTITAGGRRQTAWRIGGGSYASASDPRLHFGWDRGEVDDWRSDGPRVACSTSTSCPSIAYHLREGDARPRDGQPTGPEDGTTKHTKSHERDRSARRSAD